MSEMNLALLTACSVLLGFGLAEIWHQVCVRRYARVRRRTELIAEFTEKQLWQFISLDEWLNGQKEKP